MLHVHCSRLRRSSHFSLDSVGRFETVHTMTKLVLLIHQRCLVVVFLPIVHVWALLCMCVFFFFSRWSKFIFVSSPPPPPPPPSWSLHVPPPPLFSSCSVLFDQQP